LAQLDVQHRTMSVLYCAHDMIDAITLEGLRLHGRREDTMMARIEKPEMPNGLGFDSFRSSVQVCLFRDQLPAFSDM
jgi:hypothetical protein